MEQHKEKRRRKPSNKVKKNTQSTEKHSAKYDPALASLFASSLGPITPSSKVGPQSRPRAKEPLASGALDLSSEQESENQLIPGHQVVAEKINDDSDSDSSRRIGRVPEPELELALQQNQKRKRKHAEEDVEGLYMQKLAREEVREDAKRRKKERFAEVELSDKQNGTEASQEGPSESDSVEIVTGDKRDSSPSSVPQHESLGLRKAASDLEKASRTVFLGNVSNAAIKSKSGKKALLDHLASFLPSLPKQDTAHKVESLRFRSTAFSSSAVPKKAAFAKKELMDSTTQSTNAYAVYTTQLAAREATKQLNGTRVLDRHLRVDSIAHPAKTDHRRCVFVGNLGFVDDESAVNAAEDEANGKRPRKGKEPADLEEGLWRQFGKAGTIESVRVPRDKTTRVGKGFAYVQFEDPNGVEKALLFDGKKFPPMLPRILRVTRAKNIQKTSSRQGPERRSMKSSLTESGSGTYRPKIPSDVQSMSGRAGKLLGRAGAARYRGSGDSREKRTGVSKSPEAIVFEGYRASSKQGKGTLKLGGSGKKQGKPRTRSSKRGAAFKASERRK